MTNNLQVSSRPSTIQGSFIAGTCTQQLIENQAEQAAPFPQWDELWHFSCVVQPPIDSARTPIQGQTPRSCPPPVPSISQLHTSTAAATESQRHDDVHRIFNTFDINHDGLVSNQEIGLIFAKLGIPLHESEPCLPSLLAGHVTKLPGHVDEQEFGVLYDSLIGNDAEPDSSVAATSLEVAASCDADEDLRDAFRVFDKDGNGLISPFELQSVLCSLGFQQARQLDACVDMIARVDGNADGHVDFHEFQKLFCGLENSKLPIVTF